MPRYKLTIEYDGSKFSGWQRQEGTPSVQQSLEEAIAAFCGQPLTLHCAGRTDAGVHALAQVAHLDFSEAYDPHRILMAINAHVRPQPVSVLSVEPVAADFHARFSATARHYRYRIVNRRAPPALDMGRAWHVPVALNADTMQEAAKRLLGHHDFTSFRDSHCQAKSPMRTLDALSVTRYEQDIVVEASARSFLHHQVRIMVGTLALAGRGKWTAEEVAAALAACDRTAAGPTAPAGGLYLTGVDY